MNPAAASGERASAGRALVIGAGGEVGSAIAGELLRSGWQVVAVGRSQARLQALQQRWQPVGELPWRVGSVADAASATSLADALHQTFGGFDAVVTSVNGPVSPMAITSSDPRQVMATFQADLLPHLVAAQTFIPRLAPGSTYLVIGGGMADAVQPGLGAVSMVQAALRQLVRQLALENQGRGVRVHELLLRGLVLGHRQRSTGRAPVIDDAHVGRTVADILSLREPASEPVFTLAGRRPVPDLPGTAAAAAR